MHSPILYRCKENGNFKFNDGSIFFGTKYNDQIVLQSFKNYEFSFAKPFLNGFALIERTETNIFFEKDDIDFLSHDGSFQIEKYIKSINPYEEFEEDLNFYFKTYRLIQDFLKLRKTSNNSWENVLNSFGSESNKYHRFCKTGKYFLIHLSLEKIIDKCINWVNFLTVFDEIIQFNILKSWNIDDVYNQLIIYQSVFPIDKTILSLIFCFFDCY